MDLNRKYIIRLDDACPTMDRKKWERVEQILDEYNIKPIVAVIPDNTLEELCVGEYDNNFWERIKFWQNKGWHIALHGYNHTYIKNPGKALISINKYSEFAGLAYEHQYDKIKKGLDIFASHSIHTEIWAAPAHTFDKNTLKALKENGNIRVISDGISMYPYNKYGFFWIPQQLWDFFPKKRGVWTTCLHPNTMSEEKIIKLNTFLKEHAMEFVNNIENVKEKFKNRKKKIIDSIYEVKFFWHKIGEYKL